MKGVAFHSMLAAVEEAHGRAGRERVEAALPEALRERVARGGLTRVGWYPVRDYTAMHEAVQAALGGGETTARSLGRLSTEIDTRGLLRFVLAMASPDLLMRHADRVLGSYVRGAHVRVDELRPALYDITLMGMGGASRYVYAEFEGGLGYLLERTGAKGVSVRRRAILDDGSGATIIATWTTDAR